MNTEELLNLLAENNYNVRMDSKNIVIELSDKEEKFEPKDGDIISFGTGAIGIYKTDSGDNRHKDYAVLDVYMDYIEYDCDHWTKRNWRLATEEEKQKLFDVLSKDGKQWNSEKKCLESLKYQPKDKELVWCWNSEDICMRCLKFYDAENNRTFSYRGRRTGDIFSHYAPYEGEYPQWAKEALTKYLKD